MRYLLLSILVVCVIGVMIPSAFAEVVIKNDETGGDCTQFGTWDGGTKTCTLSNDIHDSIKFGSNNITLDGNNFKVGMCDNPDYCTPKKMCDNPDYCIKIDTRFGITIMNIESNGVIRMQDSNNIVIKNSQLYLLELRSSNQNEISDNQFAPGHGDTSSIMLVNSNENLVKNNSVIGQELNGSPYGAGIWVIQFSQDNIIQNNEVSSFSTGLKVESHEENKFIGNKIFDNANFAIKLGSSENQIFENNVITGSELAAGSIVYETYGGSHTFRDNIISDNKQGLWLTSPGNIITQNTFENNVEFAMKFGGGAAGNTVFNNNFIDNDRAIISGSATVFFTNEGGNFWSDYSLDCDDANSDKVCDEPYPFSGGTVGVNDQMVWTEKDAWKNYQPPTITTQQTQPEPVAEPVVTQESIQKVPDWVRNIFIWYAEERISEDELLNAIKFLVNQGIINLNE